VPECPFSPTLEASIPGGKTGNEYDYIAKSVKLKNAECGATSFDRMTIIIMGCRNLYCSSVSFYTDLFNVNLLNVVAPMA
jgi:hypothetical protein